MTGKYLLTNGDMPWWAKFTYTFGIPAAIALGLTAYIVSDLREDVKYIRANISVLADTKDQLHSIHNILLRTCVNLARTNEEKDNCFSHEGNINGNR